MPILMRKLPLLVFIVFSVSANAQDIPDKKIIPFEQQNKKSNFISVYTGMLVDISSGTNLKEYIETRLPGYSNLPNDQTLSTFATGFGFFAGGDFQISKSISVKIDYSYRVKDISVDAIPNHTYSVFTHRPSIGINYIIPENYAFIKFGGSVSYGVSNFRRKEFGLESNFTGYTLGFNLDLMLNLQLSNMLAVYFGGSLTGDTGGKLKDESGTVLINPKNGNEVDLSSFGAGLKIGLNVYIF
ncbi:MAG: hypothetical protein OZ913_07680 [Ignavibacteriaceae bacterium]|nr:MAG: hypothetical protein UZ04_CHB001000401 [Chlorobi bacterium OLB4]MBV6399090.1 hypothetical protein [Ignavibacteria bacterium]MCC6885308.1 hypothetical protein [Ignavibacteriales bacterium]MCE7953289.1 hypothetical protein [Chlorobi bacterium CHB7]MDL1887293.1 hypothetical protein [Ignavibacteria bacterium CHB1]MEB2330168.1 hypothetical protein [Ignavibacteriaceae bacterium]OQY78231.1 MAG: hypothetical protein B6D43_03715 [Ignavibacteriales bacterium UTCHB1]